MPLVSKSFSDIITFTRASTATYFDSAGVLKYAPNNLLVQSEDFTTTWSALNLTPTANTAISPVGTLTADTLTPAASSAAHLISQSATVNASNAYSASVFIKTDGAPFVQVTYDNGASVGCFINVNLSTGAITRGPELAGGATNATGSVTNVGNGFYRISVGATHTGTTGRILISPLPTGESTAGLNPTTTTAATDKIIVWGAQLNIGDLQSYYPTQATAYYGPRFDYNPATPAAQGLLIEEQSTDIVQSSVYTANANGWTNGVIGGTGTIAAAAVNSPVGTNAGVFNISGLNGSSYVGQFAAVTASANARTASVFVRNNGGVKFQLRLVFQTSGTFLSYGTEYDFGTGAFQDGIAGTTSPTSRSATNVGNGWLRITITGSDNGTGNTQASLQFWGAATTTNYNYLFWGAQIEEATAGASAAFPTSYIPTTTTALTRAADVASVNTLSPWYNASEGTFFVASTQAVTGTAGQLCAIEAGDGTNDNLIQLATQFGTTNFQGLVNVSSVAQAAFISAASTALTNRALAYKVNDFAQSINGGAVSTDTSGTVPTITGFGVGARVNGTSQLNGYLRRITYYPRRLSNAELVAITS